ncbi:DUF805 domain-containing protein [Glycomyces dulcitolivorans]|uniref:DUF805 domain-containing protein n=1 Tax=Glycomyces dulcitolivorans TaxID=2200759 RepID=UPI000DD45AB5|nr:DUF805 domain-containing protein [Glycomyces dulcitolivorans]
MHWYLAVLKNYIGFSGRARRKEYWMFLLIHLLIAFALIFLLGALGDGRAFLIPFYLYFLATLIPALGVIVRRLHDTGKSGWLYLLNFIPAVGGVILLVMLAQEGHYGSNQYGEDPRES